MSSAIVVSGPRRDNQGRWLPGCDPTNPEGHNQWSEESLTARRARVNKRLQMATLDKLGKPLCVETTSRNWAMAISCPDLAPHTARLASERCLPIAKHDQPDGQPPPDSSEDQWAAIAERAGGEVEDVADLAVAEPEPGPVEGAD